MAIKVLPSGFSIDRDRLRRFEQEARAASALNHPNIITIHEFGQEEGVHFIVSEFIEGETLRRRIGSGRTAGERMSAAEILEITIQITGALNAAHEAGIVHRDIKPENVMVRPDGLVKVLDFGLAKLIERRSSENVGRTSVCPKPGQTEVRPTFSSEATDLDPAFALAHAGLEDCYVLGGGYPMSVHEAMSNARASALLALKLDETLGEAHASLAQAQLFNDWNLAEAEASFKRAIELKPDYETAHHWYAIITRVGGAIPQCH